MWQLTKKQKEQQKYAIMHKNHKFLYENCSYQNQEADFLKSTKD